MTSYVFIPGGMRTGKDWDAVRAILESCGKRTYAITLSPPKTSSLAEHISEVCDLIEKEHILKTVLVGHSYASFVLNGVFDKIPERIEKLIYVDTILPENGKSLFDFFREEGVDTEKYGIPRFEPFTDKLYFDEAKLAGMPKAYIRCLRSHFAGMTEKFARHISEHKNDEYWQYFEIDSDHSCMINNPDELAELILKIN